jgi:hypothetical protein
MRYSAEIMRRVPSRSQLCPRPAGYTIAPKKATGYGMTNKLLHRVGGNQ